MTGWPTARRERRLLLTALRSVDCLAVGQLCPGSGRGFSAVRGWFPLDTDYRADDGQPLITAVQAEQIYGIKRRTVYQWRARGYLARRGLAEDGRELYAAGEIAAVKARPRKREQVAA